MRVTKVVMINLTKTFYRDLSGQFAMMYAFLAFPILIAIAYVTDMTYAGKVKEELKGSLDAAALAAVINQNLSEQERAAFAKAHFNQNFDLSDQFEVNVANASPKQVELIATGGFPSYIGAMTGRNKFNLTSHATSILTKEDVICMLALDEQSEGAFTAEKNAKFLGQNCSVQVNSTHSRAAIVDGSSSVTAKSFCVSGGATGYYSPSVNSECARVGDPFESLEMPVVGDNDCAVSPIPVGISTGPVDVSPKWISVGDNAILRPGVYCRTVSIEGKDVVFVPGTYIFQQDLEFFNGSEVISGEGVTLILNGPTSVLYMQGGSSINIKAPARGPYAGLAIAQNRNAANIGAKGYSAISEIRNGSGMNITGTVYLPTHRIEISKDSNTAISNQLLPTAPATSFIASQLHIFDAATSVAVDHKAAGLPPMLPRSDEGARLVE